MITLGALALILALWTLALCLLMALGSWLAWRADRRRDATRSDLWRRGADRVEGHGCVTPRTVDASRTPISFNRNGNAQ